MATIAREVPRPAQDSPLTTLLADGYCVIQDAVERRAVDALSQALAPDFLSTPMAKGPFYGSSTKRFHRLPARTPLVHDFILHPLIIDIVEEVLGPACDRVQLNLTQAIEIQPGGRAQPPHRDQDMWPVRATGVEYLVNVMWPFTPYTAANGATLIWPGSHRQQQDVVLDPNRAVPIEMEPGSVLLFLGSTLHAGGANRATDVRRGMIVSYSLGWLKPYELPWLAYPPEVACQFPPRLQALAGYSAHRPNLGTFEGHCPSLLLKDPDSPYGAIDVLRPEQEELIARYYAGELAFAPVDTEGPQ